MSDVVDTVVAEHYQHVDNGGLTMKVLLRSDDGYEEGYPILRIEDGYYGYSGHILEFCEVKPEELRKFAEMMIVAANKLEEK
jgi:hypothetical protein